jgi:integrase
MPKRNAGSSLKWREERQVYEIQWFENGQRKRRSTGTAVRKDAEKQLTEHITFTHRPTGRLHPDERFIDDILADYVQERGRFLKSQKTLTNCINELAPFWGDKTAQDVREETCREYWKYRDSQYKKRAKVRKGGGYSEPDVKPSVVARELSVLAAAINHDFKRSRLTTPVHVWKPRFDNRKDRWLTRKEAAAILKKAKAKPDSRDYLPLFILIGLYTGARHSAILGLRWPQVDLERRLIDFRDGEPTNKGRSVIPIPDRLLTFLRLARRRGTATGHVVHRSQNPIQSLKKGFGEACTAAKVKGVSPHTLRHTAASWMAQKGVAFPKIARYLGHSDSRTTERIYAHHNPDYLKDAADSFNRTLPQKLPQKAKKRRKKVKLKR